MGYIVDTRSAGGEFIILGDSFTLPTSNSVIANPLQGSLRYNPISGNIEFFTPTSEAWTSIGSGSADSVPLVGDSVITGNVVINGSLTVTGLFNGEGGNSNGIISFDISTYTAIATGTTASRDMANRFGEWLDLKDFGAIGNGSNDDTTAVAAWWSALIASQLPGFVPAGTYKITSQLVWDLVNRRNGITIIGTGAGTSVFDVSAVSSSPAVNLTCSLGSSTNNKFIGLGFNGNLVGNVLQLGNSSFTDPMTDCEFDFEIANISTSSSAFALAINSVSSSKIRINAYCNNNGTAVVVNQLTLSDIYGNLSNANIGLYITNGNSYGNTFLALNIFDVGYCVKIDSATAYNNTFIGGEITWTLYGVDAYFGSSNVFFNVTLGSSNSTVVWHNVGLIFTNGAVEDINSEGIVIDNVANLLANIVVYSIGTEGYATDGRKPQEYIYPYGDRYDDPSTHGSGAPVYYGYADYPSLIANNATWISVLDGYPISS